MKHRIVVGVSGASGMPLAVEVLDQLRRQPDVETHLVLSRAAEITLREESSLTAQQMRGLADVCYDNGDIGAAPASGSFRTAGMIVVPCSMKTVAGIATGYSDSLLLRAADVTLKERRKLVLAVRECPFSTIHLRNMLTLQEAGAVIMPFSPGFYLHPRTLDEMLEQFCGRILDQLSIDHPLGRWGSVSVPQTTAHKEQS